MNILFLFGSHADPVIGGIERVTSVLGDYFESRGHRCFFLSLPHDAHLNDKRQFYLPARGFLALENRDFLASFVKEHNIDTIINQGGIDPKLSGFALSVKESAEAQKIRVISVVHSTLNGHIKNFRAAYANKFSAPLRLLLPLTGLKIIKKALLLLYKLKYGRHYRVLCAKSDAVVLLSDKFKEELAFFIGCVPRNVYAIPSVSFNLENIDFGVKKKELLYVGRIDFGNKRVDLLLRIWDELFRDFPDWSLRIVGGGGGLVAAQTLAKKLNLENIVFTGFQNPQGFLREASIFCFTSSFEGFAIVLVEAMSSGLVPFAFNSYLSVTDIIDDGVNGVLVPPFDIDEYARALRKFMTNAALREKFALAAMEKAKTFSIEVTGKKWLSLFDNLS